MKNNSNVFNHLESEVRSYCRAFPVVFNKARGSFLYDESGREYLDFFSGAGALNYGHNNPVVKKAVMEYLEQDGVMHALDMWTVAKREFLEAFERTVLKPRNLDYKVQFTGPTGANAVEAALKLARKVKQRSNVIAFTNGYHGLSAGALALTGNRHFRNEAFITRLNASIMPFDGYLGKGVNTLEFLRRALADNSSGVDVPAAIIIETIQAEGGINVARDSWLRELQAICREFDILLIVDDIQVGNGRSGTFFSFESAGIEPDLVVLSKSIGGLGLPMSLVLIKRPVDLWKPAEHTGTFRGNNLAFVAARAALLEYWSDGKFEQDIVRKGKLLEKLLTGIKRKFPELMMNVRGRGLIYGLEIPELGFAKRVSQYAFEHGMIIELAGADDQVLKFLPPLVVEDALLKRGTDIVFEGIENCLSARAPRRNATVRR